MARIFISVVFCLVSVIAHGQGSREETLESPSTLGGLEGEISQASEEEMPHVRKYRADSLLIRNDEFPLKSDLRGDFERRRDYELQVHYRRLAEFEVIEGLALKVGDSSLVGRVEQIRRLEKKRFRGVIQELRAASLYKLSVGTP